MTQNKLISLLTEFKQLGIDKQIDYDKFHLYSMMTINPTINVDDIAQEIGVSKPTIEQANYRARNIGSPKERHHRQRGIEEEWSMGC